MVGVTFITTTATLFVISALLIYRQGAQARNDTRVQIEHVLSTLADAETAQRNYLITGSDSFLTPYKTDVAQVPGQMSKIIAATKGDDARADVEKLNTLVAQRVQLMAQTVALAQAGDTPAVQQAVASGAGPAIMDQVRGLVLHIEATESAQLASDHETVAALGMLARDMSVLNLLAVLVLSGLIYWTYLKAIQSERRLDRAKDEFVSLASHQLRTPASGIKSILATLKSGDFGPLNERQDYFIGRALQSNERELSIIEELLNVAKADAGRLTLHATVFDLDALVGTILGEQRPAIAEKGLKLEVRRPARPVNIVADEEKLYMAIGNLLDNARKYTPETGKILVAVSANHGQARVEVTDTGIGIEPDDISHIFDRFHRAREAVDGHAEGTGLGLYLAGRIAELHDGAIEVNSKLGKGTKFVMILPQGDWHAAQSIAGGG